MCKFREAILSLPERSALGIRRQYGSHRSTCSMAFAFAVYDLAGSPCLLHSPLRPVTLRPIPDRFLMQVIPSGEGFTLEASSSYVKE